MISYIFEIGSDYDSCLLSQIHPLHGDIVRSSFVEDMSGKIKTLNYNPLRTLLIDTNQL